MLAGTGAAVDFIASLSGVDAAGVDTGGVDTGSRRERVLSAMTAVAAHEDQLRRTIEEQLAALPGVVVHSRARLRTPTLLLTFDDHDPGDASRYLADRGINAPAGSFYALEASRRLGLGDTGGLRIGLAPYTNAADVDRLLGGLRGFLAA